MPIPQALNSKPGAKQLQPVVVGLLHVRTEMPVPRATAFSNPPAADVLAILQQQQTSELRATQRSAEGSRLLEGASDATRQLMLFVRAPGACTAALPHHVRSRTE